MTLDKSIAQVRGFRVAGIHTGLKADNALDMALIVSDRHCNAAGVFTLNQMLGAPVIVSKEHLQAQPSGIRAVVVNTKYANAATGRAGIENARTMARMVAEHLQCAPDQIIVMSTGVIGSHLPMTKIETGIQRAYENLGDHWQATADAIRTTDTYAKLVSKTVYTSDGHYTVAGIAKGSGMIAPNMATMLALIVTDVKLSQGETQKALSTANEQTFNRIVVDGDTSPNDMVILLANGASGVHIRTRADYEQFVATLLEVSRSLAQEIVRDGEGATKFITLHIQGAASDADAHVIANTIATSPLVKTAFAGNDANWGRIIAAAGRSNAPFDPETASLWISPGEELFEDDAGLLIFHQGMPASYQESDAADIMAEESIYVTLNCGDGDGKAIVWTCDLTHDYVSINGDYRT